MNTEHIPFAHDEAEPVGVMHSGFRLLRWSTDKQGRGIALINGQSYTHEQVRLLHSELGEVLRIGSKESA